MTNRKPVTKLTLVSAVVALMLCFAMLLGTTYAWFTDSVTSTGNIIKTGELNVELEKWNGTGWVPVTGPIFTDGTTANDSTATLWEPGKTQVVYLRIKNVGNLALKYQVAITVTNNPSDALLNAFYYGIVPDATPTTVASWSNVTTGAHAAIGYQVVSGPTDVELAVGVTHNFALAIHMDEAAGNDVMSVGTTDQKITFDLALLATQLTAESDSFGSDYDAEATMAAETSATVTAGESMTMSVPVAPQENQGTEVVFEANALDAGDYNLVTKTENNVDGSNFTVSCNGGYVAAAIDFTLTHGTTEVHEFNGGKTATITTYIPTGLTGVSVSYTGTDGLAQPTLVSYNSTTGELVFTTNHFSEYAVTCTNEAYNATTDTIYAKLSEAVSAAEKNNTVVLLNNVELGGEVVVNKSMVLNLNGKEVTQASNANGADSVSGLIKAQGSDVVLTLTGGGSVSASYDTRTHRGMMSAICAKGEGATININGVEINNDFTGASNNIAVYAYEGGHVNIYNGKFIGYGGGTSVSTYDTNNYGSLINIYDGEFIGEGDDGPGCAWANGGTINIFGGSYVTVEMTAQGITHELEEEGANYCLFDYAEYEAYGYHKGTITVTGGTFVNFDPTSFCGAGFHVVNNNGTYTVVAE